MHPLHLRWKKFLLSGGIGLIGIWTLYLGAVALFAPMNSSRDDGDDRSSQRTFASPHDGAGTNSPAALSANESGNVHTRATSRGDDSQAKNSVPAPRLGRKITGQLTKLNSASRGAPVMKSGANPRREDPREILRESIMNEAYTLAIKSEKPWRNLMAVAVEYYRRGEKVEAQQILCVAEKMAADPDEPLGSSIAVREVVKVMLAQRLTQDAMAALQNIQNTRERERAVGEVAAWAARFGDIEIARSLIFQIAKVSDRDVALVAIAESEASFEGLRIALQTVSGIVSSRKKDDAYKRIALKRSGLKDFSGAELALLMIGNDKLKDATTVSLARQRARSGDVAGGLQALQNVSDQSMSDTSLRELAEELAQLGRFSSSAYVSTRIRSANERSHAIERLSVEQARSGDLSGSLVRTDSIPVDSVRERTLRGVSSVTADIGSPARARNVAIRINSEKERDRAYRAIAEAAASDGNHQVAYNTLQEIDVPAQKALALVSMARTRQRQGDDRQALAMLEDANRTSYSVTSTSTVDQIQSGLAVAYAERQNSGHSLIIADNIRDSRRRDATYGSLARTFAGNDIQAAQQSIVLISSDKVRNTAEDAVARILANKVSPKDAVNESRELNSERQKVAFLLAVSRKT